MTLEYSCTVYWECNKFYVAIYCSRIYLVPRAQNLRHGIVIKTSFKPRVSRMGLGSFVTINIFLNKISFLNLLNQNIHINVKTSFKFRALETLICSKLWKITSFLLSLKTFDSDNVSIGYETRNAQVTVEVRLRIKKKQFFKNKTLIHNSFLSDKTFTVVNR